MSSPSKYYSSSPIRNLEDRYNSRPLETILEQNNALRLSNSLIFHNKILEQENERLINEYSIKKDQELYQSIENTKLKQQRQAYQQRFRSLQARSIAEKQVKDKQLQSQQRDIRFLRDQFDRQNQNLRDQVVKLTSKISSLETEKLQDMQKLQKKYASNALQETDLVKRNLGEQLKQIFGELTVARKLLMEKQLELQHLVNVNHQNSLQYTHNLERLISENNILRNQLLALELDKNKEIQVVQNKKELQKSRTIGILSYCKENNHFIEKELTRLAEQLLQKNISIQSFTKELLKQRKQSDANERKFQDTIIKMKQQMAEALADKDSQILKHQKSHKIQISDLIESNMNLQEQISSKNNEIQNTLRELEYTKHNIDLKDKQINELKDNINRMHDDHSKQLSKVMTESRVKRRSGLNMSSYSSSSLKELEQPQGSSILKGDKYERKSSFSHEGSGRLPTVKEELAVSHGQIDDDEDIQIKQLILHYESMIQELKKNKVNEIELKNGQIDTLQAKIARKDAEIKQILTKFSPLMQLQSQAPDINAQRRAKIEQTKKADISILSVLLDKYQIAALKPRNK